MAPAAALFETLDLSVLHTGRDDAPDIWLSAVSKLGAVQAHPVAPHMVDLPSLECDARWFRKAIGQGTPDTGRARQLGADLRDLVFGVDAIASLFRRTRGAAAVSGRPMLVRLLAAPQTVAALPWELMLDPDGKDPIVFATDAHLVRRARDRLYPLRLDPVAVPLNVLLILSNPTGETAHDVPFDHYEEGRALLEDLRDLIDAGVLVVDVENRPSIENLRRRIGQRPRGYHVVHYLGHAGPEGFKLEDPHGLARWVSSTRFNGLLRACPDLRVAFFAGCRTAGLPSAEGDDFSASLSSADVCVRDACQTVVGMQAVLPFRVEQILTRAFYQAVCSGASVARAITLARGAVRDDEIVGAPLLNWAVPAVVTGHEPDAIIAPGAEATPPDRPRRIQLKLDLNEPDREFFARFSQLRQVISVLSRLSPQRVVAITGAAGAGKTRLLARSLDEIDPHTTVLYTPASRLAQHASPIEGICELLCELLERAHRPPPARRAEWGRPIDWWDRIIEELVDTPFVLAIDDLDGLGNEPARELGAAVELLVQRVSMARVALAAEESPVPRFLSARITPLVAPVHVMTPSPNEVTQWIRRNRPGLAAVLEAAPDTERAEVHNALGPSLHLWSQLDQELHAQVVTDVLGALKAVVASLPARLPAEAEEESPLLPGGPAEPAAMEPGRRGTGPLRVVIAGPFTTGRQEEFAKVIATLALRHDAGARVVLAGDADVRTAAAKLLPTASLFDQSGKPTSIGVLPWLHRAAQEKPDVVVLDFVWQSSPAPEEALSRLASTALVIAAGGNSGRPSWPAWSPEVLAIGATDEHGRPTEYSPYFPDARKPDLYALGTVEGTPLRELVNQPDRWGTSFAAFHALTAAVLVWSLDRAMGPRDVADLLGRTATPIPHAGGARRINVDQALEHARLRVVAQRLAVGPMDEAALVAATGLPAGHVAGALRRLVSEKRVARTSSGQLVADREQLADLG